VADEDGWVPEYAARFLESGEASVFFGRRICGGTGGGISANWDSSNEGSLTFSSYFCSTGERISYRWKAAGGGMVATVA